MNARAVLMVASLVISSAAVAQSYPSEDGTYIKNADHWDKLYMASSSGAHASGAAKTAFSYGIASAKSVLVFRDATAPVKSSSARPIFEVVGNITTAPRDVVIVRLKQKKDHRELQIGEFNAYTGMKLEYPPADVISVDVKDEGKNRIVTPQSDLAPGEYILFTGTPSPMPSGYGGFDFSVSKP